MTDPADAALRRPLQRRRCVVVMYDTLCRHFMPTYGNEWIIAPNFRRLARRSAQFQNFYVGSMPCMPARREMHTGRHNFLHRSWGPLEPFDDSMPELLGARGVHTHKVTDHHHYWEDGGATYHQRYTSFDLVRGQEGDKWKGDVKKLRDPKYGAGRWPEILPGRGGSRMQKQDAINREYMPRSEDQPQHHTFSLGLEFIERNVDADNWYVQIETFDPHEPFFTHEEFQKLYPHEYDGPPFDWPPYREVREDKQTVEHIRYMYAALVSFCDKQLGRVLDAFDRHNLWEDTMLIVNTDHGFLMGEHDWWAKVVTPFFQEIAHIPFWVYDPRHPDAVGVRREALSQTMDLPPTVLDFFGVAIPPDMQGRVLEGRLLRDAPVRDCALYGVFGGQVNATDGRYVYMRGPATADNAPLNEYTLMPTHMTARFAPSELRDWERHDGYGFTKGCKVMRVPSRTPAYFLSRGNPMGYGRMATLLFDIAADPGQASPLSDADAEARMVALMLRAMDAGDCPEEQYVRLGLPRPAEVTPAAVRAACVAGTRQGRADAAHGGGGHPQMPFAAAFYDGRASFPASLRLRPGYAFSQTRTPPRKPARSRL